MIPQYRAKKIDSDEYVEGYVRQALDGKVWIIPIGHIIHFYEIDPKTLAIHFPNSMIDKNGKKIFASLSEDGVGGDICEQNGYKGIVYYSTDEFVFVLKSIYSETDEAWLSNGVEVIGIHNG